MGIFYLYDKVTAENWGHLVCKIKRMFGKDV